MHQTLKILLRLLHRFADGDERGEVDHGFGLVLAHQFGERVRLAQVQLEKSPGRDVVLFPLREVVNYSNVVALIEEQTHSMRANVSGAPGH